MRSTPPWLRAATRIALLGAIPTACAPTTASVATDPPPAATSPAALACRAFAPILWSTRDTDETIRQVRAHNAAHRALCGAGPAGGEGGRT